MLLRTVVCPSVEAEDATVGSREELEFFFLRTLHICNVDRVAVRLEVLESLEYWIGILTSGFTRVKYTAWGPLF